MQPRFFETPAEFAAWLAGHHDSSSELLVGYWKKATGKPSVSWEETVDEALCWGWIDGVRRSIDDDSYSIRFTPRRPGSIWSARNIARVQALLGQGRMQPAGIAAWKGRSEDAGYSAADRADVAFSSEQLDAFGDGLGFYEELPPGLRKQWTQWVLSAKRQETRDRRLHALVVACQRGIRLHPQRPFEHLD